MNIKNLIEKKINDANDANDLNWGSRLCERPSIH
jgi:hypothetical protein